MGAEGGSPMIGTAALQESRERGRKTITVSAADDRHRGQHRPTAGKLVLFLGLVGRQVCRKLFIL